MQRAVLYILLSLFLLLLGRFHYNHPGYNWDMLPYMGIVLKYDGSSNLHQKVYSIAKSEFPASNFKQLTDSNHSYRWSVYKSPETFNLQLPYYVVKPLYTGLAFVCYKAGIPLSKAVVLPSIIACVLLALLLFYWLHQYMPLLPSLISTIALMVWNPLMHLAGTASPDALSALLLFAAFYLVEKKKQIWVYILAYLAIFARIDNLLPAVVLIFFMVYEKRSESIRPWVTGTIVAAGCIVCYLAVGALAKEYDWNMLYFSNYFTRMNPEYELQKGFSIENYWEVMKSQFMSGLYYSQLPLFFFLSILIIVFRKTVMNKIEDEVTLLIAAIWFIILIRFILHPMAADRIYMAYYLVLVLLLVKCVCGYFFPATTVKKMQPFRKTADSHKQFRT